MSFRACLFVMFAASISLIFLSDLVFHVILGEVNGKLPAQQRYSMFFVNVRLPEIMKRHAELYPDSSKRILTNLCFAIGAIVGVGTVIVGVIHYSGSGHK